MKPIKHSRRFAIVVSRYNAGITEALLSGALKEFSSNGIDAQSVEVFKVSGAFEIPLVVKKLCRKKRYHGIVTLGCILKGETTHNEYIARSVAQELGRMSVEEEIPIAFGILTPNTHAQAQARAGNNSQNKGRESALAVIESDELLRRI